MMSDDGLSVSISQLKEFAICPRRYQLHRVLGVEPAFVPVPLALGSAIHTALADGIYTAIHDRGEVAPLDEVLQVFRDAWSVAASGPVPIKIDEDDAAAPIDTGVRMLAAFHQHVMAAGPVNVVAVELPFSGVALRDPDSGEVLEETLSGVLDLVVAEGGGDGDASRNVIVEHKTAGRKWTRDQLDHDIQLSAYQMAAREIGLGEEVGLRFQVVTKTKLAAMQIEDVVRDDLAEVDFLRTATGILRAIGAGAFWPVRSWACKSCQYAHACNSRSRR